MRSSLILAAALALPMAAPMAAHAGCLGGAVLGGVAGHVAGGHGLLGAGAGCVAGHEYSKHKAEKAQQQQMAPANNQSGSAPAGND